MWERAPFLQHTGSYKDRGSIQVCRRSWAWQGPQEIWAGIPSGIPGPVGSRKCHDPVRPTVSIEIYKNVSLVMVRARSSQEPQVGEESNDMED